MAKRVWPLRFTNDVHRPLTYIYSLGMAKLLLNACCLDTCSSTFRMKISSSMRLEREMARLLSTYSTTCKTATPRYTTARDTGS